MLVLTRGVGQTVVIEGVGTVSVEHIHNGRVRLGFEFPPEVKVRRGELSERPEPTTDRPASPWTRKVRP